MKKYKILIADDESQVLDIMAKKIRGEGYDVVTARDGAEAWEKIKSDSPDIVLLDLSMPKMDGFEVLGNLRKNPPSKKWQPVIIVSAKNELEDMQKGLDLEADHYITKPCLMGDILKGIKLMINLIPQRKLHWEMDEEKPA